MQFNPVTRKSPATACHDCTYGAQTLNDGTTRFRVWAPRAERVDLVIDDLNVPMERDAEGNHSLLIEVDPDTRYLFRIGDRQVPDPASRAQPGGVLGASMVVDPYDYVWKCNDWNGIPWHHAAICELHVGVMGGFDGVCQALSRLAGCGYTAIELMPIASFQGDRNWGYDGVLPYAPDASYGTIASLKAMIDEAHRLGVAVILDVVYNHFGPVGNELPSYAPEFFRDDVHTPWGAAIDFRQPQVARYFIDNALMWINEYRFDGLRLDAVHAIQPQTFLEELGAAVRRACLPHGREVWLILENEHNAASLLRGDYNAQWNDDAHNALHVLLTGEHEGYYADFAKHPTHDLAKVLSEGFVFQGQLDRRGIARGEPSQDLPPTSFALFLQNHDQIGNRPLGERLTCLANDADLRAAMVLVALSPMIPLFFMGEEWGCRTPFYYFTDYEGELAQKVREGRREEFAHFSGFTDPERCERIPDPNALDTYAASIPRVEDSMLALAWKRWFAGLLQLRKRYLADRLAARCALGCDVLGEKALYARWRLSDGHHWEIALNLSNRDVSLPRDSATKVLWIEPQGAMDALDHGTLAAHSAVVMVRELEGERFIA
ncbi:malto-oligosyltrehalose trehalohydrolase [Dyella nitratireducens]|uniref:Malto-oligosyltrehalose trehalohydrolase n=1 Tax=Dyella nitratireducens TaxID=1849580 RepID=A0ABQ1GFU5_9GAMM|nr:malto-oligosyltrehalose trehalohydrolase [Dyella nitratireducens]GGA42658.1 malto-oligosyltrehalose trehalohydrolase [Dyella nitratireducens]GLQ41973.1 malto-oligosyltrehalose trehalohydrolase [Dyella nitratireducens]